MTSISLPSTSHRPCSCRNRTPENWNTDDLHYVITNWKIGRQPALCQLFHGTRAPCGPDPLHCRGLTITIRYTTLGRTSLDESLQTSTWQHTTRTRYTYPSGRIRTHNPNQRTAADPRLKLRGHWDRMYDVIINGKLGGLKTRQLTRLADKYNYRCT